MANNSNLIQEIVSEFHQFSAEQRVKWLLGAIHGDVPELILSPGGTSREGLELFARSLERIHDQHLSSTAVHCLQQWIAASINKPRNAHPNGTIISLFEILAFDPTPTTAKFLHDIIHDKSCFDILPKGLRLIFLNVLENQRVPTPTALLIDLLNRNPDEYGVYVFCILAAQNLTEALDLLPRLPDTNDVRRSLSMSIDWLLEIIPANGRNTILQAIASKMLACPMGIQRALVEGFEEAGCPLPKINIAPKLSLKFIELLYTLSPAERVPVNPCRSFFCRA